MTPVPRQLFLLCQPIVTSCAPCNRRKGNRTTVETGMHPRQKPHAPGPTIFIRVAAPVLPEAWQQYLP